MNARLRGSRDLDSPDHEHNVVSICMQKAGKSDEQKYESE